MRRRENYGAELPEGVLLLTAAVDVQDNRLEYEICGWGMAEECWGIKKGTILGVPDTPKVWDLSLIHISEPTRLGMISYAVFCLKKKKSTSTRDRQKSSMPPSA